MKKITGQLFYALVLKIALLLPLILYSAVAQSESQVKIFSIKYPAEFELKDNIANIPLNTKNIVPVVQVDIFGKQYNFLIDTGSEISKIDETVLSAGHVPFIAQVKVKLNNRPKIINIYNIEALTLNNLTIKSLPVTLYQETMHQTLISLLERNNIHGILGFSAFHQLLLEFDFIQESLSVSRDSLANTQATPLLQIPNESIPIVSAHLYDGTHSMYLPMVIDTGYMSHVRMPSNIPRLPFKHHANVRNCHGIHVQGLQSCKEMQLDARMRIANLFWSSPIVQIGRQDSDYTLSTPYGLIGMGILKNYIVSIDSKNHLIRMSQ